MLKKFGKIKCISKLAEELRKEIMKIGFMWFTDYDLNLIK
jgi:hypothetical protein